MALVPNRPGALVRRITAYSLIADVIVALVIGLAVSSIIGWIVFLIGLAITALVYFNFRQVMKARGIGRW